MGFVALVWEGFRKVEMRSVPFGVLSFGGMRYSLLSKERDEGHSFLGLDS